MSVMSAAAVNQVDWSKHEVRLRRMSREWLFAMIVMAAGLALYTAVYLHVYPGFSTLPFGIGFALLITLAVRGVVRRSRAAQNPTVTLELRRKWLERMTGKGATAAVIASAVAIPLLFWSDRGNLLGLFVFVQTAALVAHHFLIQRPAAMRELAELRE
jgi:hypothetical protein